MQSATVADSALLEGDLRELPRRIGNTSATMAGCQPKPSFPPATPPRRNRLSQQRAFDAFRRDYNETRPHEALGQIPPAAVYRASLREFSMHLEGPAYPVEALPSGVDNEGRFRAKK